MLAPSGEILVFDYCSPMEQELEIVETTRAHPHGLKIHFRSYKRVREAFHAAGLSNIEFFPFHIPIDLPEPPDDFDVTTHTITTMHGERLSMRGILRQPWCHVRVK